MTQTSGSMAPDYVADDIDVDADTPSAQLSRAADGILEQDEGRVASHATPLRQAVREDLSHGREWVRTRAHGAREAIQDEPLKTTLYAVGVGVLIGLLMSR